MWTARVFSWPKLSYTPGVGVQIKKHNGRRDRRCVNNYITLLDFYKVEKRFKNSRSGWGFQIWSRILLASLDTENNVFWKQNLLYKFWKFYSNTRSTRNKCLVRTNQLLALLCLLLSNDVPLNPRLIIDYYQCISCNKDQVLDTEHGFGKIVWICDSCIDTFYANSTTDHSM